MSRSLSYLRRGLLGIALMGSLGFGATQALAAPPRVPQARFCVEEWCNEYCEQQGLMGTCRFNGTCWCHA